MSYKWKYFLALIDIVVGSITSLQVPLWEHHDNLTEHTNNYFLVSGILKVEMSNVNGTIFIHGKLNKFLLLI